MTDFARENALLARLDVYAEKKDDRPEGVETPGGFLILVGRDGKTTALTICFGAPKAPIFVPLLVLPRERYNPREAIALFQAVEAGMGESHWSACLLAVKPTAAVGVVSGWEEDGRLVATYYVVGRKGHLSVFYKGTSVAEALRIFTETK